MIKKETLELIAKLTKTKVADLEAAIKDEKEVDFAIDAKMESFTEGELTTLKTNEYTTGKTAGVEMSVKEMKDELGLSFTGKTLKGLIEAATKKALDDAKLSPDKKVVELNEKITTLQNTIATQDTEIEAQKQIVAKTKINAELYRFIPNPGEEGPSLGHDDIVQLMRVNGYDFELQNGSGLVVKKDGKIVQDKLSNPVKADEVIKTFMTEKKLLPSTTATGGRGGGNPAASSKPIKMSEAKKEWEAQGKHTAGEEFSAHISKLKTENKEFDMNS